MTLPEFIEFAELAAHLGLTKSQLRRGWQSGRFPPPIRLTPRRLVWPVATIQEWLAAQQAEPPVPAEHFDTVFDIQPRKGVFTT